MIAEVVDILQFVGLWVGGSIGGAGAIVGASEIRHRRTKSKSDKRRKAELIERTTDGRLDTEWYDLIKGMGKEEYERLSRGALDGLEESKVHKWDAQKLMGKAYFDKLMREWYPERYEVKEPVVAKSIRSKELDYYKYKYTYSNTEHLIKFNSISTEYDFHVDPVKQAKKRIIMGSLEDMSLLQNLLNVRADSLMGRRTMDAMFIHSIGNMIIGDYGAYFISVHGREFVVAVCLIDSYNANGCRKYYVKKVQSIGDHDRKTLAKMAVETYKVVN